MALQEDTRKSERNTRKTAAARNKSGTQQAAAKMADQPQGQSNLEIKTQDPGRSRRSKEMTEANVTTGQADEDKVPENNNDVEMSEDDESSAGDDPNKKLHQEETFNPADDVLFPPLGQSIQPFDWAEEMTKNEDKTTLKSIEEVMQTASTAASVLEGLVYDYYDRASRIEDQSKQHEALKAFEANGAAKQRHDELMLAINQCQLALKKVNERMEARTTTQTKRTYASTSASVASVSRTNSSLNRSYGRPKYKDEGQYALTLTLKTDIVIDIKAAVDKAIDKLPVHVDKFEPRGLSGHFTFRSGKEMEDTANVLKNFKYNDTVILDHYELKMEIKSRYMIQTDLVPHNCLARMPFIKDGKVILDIAKEKLKDRNHTWFDKPSDIINVTYRDVDNGRNRGIQFTLYLSKKAHSNAMADKKRGVKLDMVAEQVVIYDATPKLTCHKCHAPGHLAAVCPQELPQCIYCVAKHLSKICPVKYDERKHICYKCREWNVKNRNLKKRNENHYAFHADCETEREHKLAAKAARMNKKSRK